MTDREHDAERLARILRGHERRLNNLEEGEAEDATPRPLRQFTDLAVATDSISASVVSDPTMIWDDADRGWDYSEWGE